MAERICLLIKTFPHQVVISLILTILSLDCLLIMLRENWLWSLLGLKELISFVSLDRSWFTWSMGARRSAWPRILFRLSRAIWQCLRHTPKRWHGTSCILTVCAVWSLHFLWRWVDFWIDFSEGFCLFVCF